MGAELSFDAAGRLVVPRPGSEAGHVALACAFNDRRYRAVCSDAVHGQNSAAGRCTDRCREYAAGGLTVEDYPCYESVLFRTWRMGLGARRAPAGAGRPYGLRGVRLGALAFLTTRRPLAPEGERVVFGVLHVAAVRTLPDPSLRPSGPAEGEFVVGDPRTSVEVAPDARARFWDHYPGPVCERSSWGSAPFRPVPDEVALAILRDLAGRCEAVRDRRSSRVLLGHLGRLGSAREG